MMPYPELTEMTKQYLIEHTDVGFKAFEDGDIELAIKQYDHTNKVMSFYVKKIRMDPQYSHDVYVQLIAVCDVFGYLTGPVGALEKKIWPYIAHRFKGMS